MTPRILLIINGLLVLGLLGAAGLVVLGWHELSTAAVWGRLLIGVGAAGVIGIGVMFFLRAELRANLTLSGVTILLSLWVVSWILHERQLTPWEVRLRDSAAAAEEAGVPFDSRTPTQVIRDLRRSSIDAVPTLSATTVLFNQESGIKAQPADNQLRADMDSGIVPLAGRSRSTTVVCNEHGDYLIIEADRYGFNNPDYAYAAASSLLVLGDSFAFGYCVRPGQDIGNQLRTRDVDVVSLGYPGTGPLIQLAQLREYGQIIQPSAILWFYYHGNDLVNLSEEYAQPALRRYLDPDHHENLPARQAQIDAFWTEYIEREALQSDRPSGASLGDIMLLKPLRDRLVGRTPDTGGRGWPKASIERFEELLDAFIAEARTLNAPLYFVFLPAYGQFAGIDENNLQQDREEVLTAISARGLPIIDFEARLLATDDPLQYFPFRKHGHYTEAAYGMLAEQILEQLHQDSLRGAISATP